MMGGGLRHRFWWGAAAAGLNHHAPTLRPSLLPPLPRSMRMMRCRDYYIVILFMLLFFAQHSIPSDTGVCGEESRDIHQRLYCLLV